MSDRPATTSADNDSASSRPTAESGETREVVTDRYPVTPDGHRLYRCLSCGRIFDETEDACGIGCPTGVEDAWGLANTDREYEWVEKTEIVTLPSQADSPPADTPESNQST